MEKKAFKALVMISQIGITMLVPIFLCLYLGIKLDEWFSTNYITIIGILLGIMAAFRNVYIITKQFYAKDKAKEDEKLKYFESLKQKQSNDSTKE